VIQPQSRQLNGVLRHLEQLCDLPNPLPLFSRLTGIGYVHSDHSYLRLITAFSERKISHTNTQGYDKHQSRPEDSPTFKVWYEE
jgi:hypothetical protein